MRSGPLSLELLSLSSAGWRFGRFDWAESIARVAYLERTFSLSLIIFWYLVKRMVFACSSVRDLFW